MVRNYCTGGSVNVKYVSDASRTTVRSIMPSLKQFLRQSTVDAIVVVCFTSTEENVVKVGLGNDAGCGRDVFDVIRIL